jgi:hypothetical protein
VRRSNGAGPPGYIMRMHVQGMSSDLSKLMVRFEVTKGSRASRTVWSTTTVSRTSASLCFPRSHQRRCRSTIDPLSIARAGHAPGCQDANGVGRDFAGWEHRRSEQEACGKAWDPDMVASLAICRKATKPSEGVGNSPRRPSGLWRETYLAHRAYP